MWHFSKRPTCLYRVLELETACLTWPQPPATSGTLAQTAPLFPPLQIHWPPHWPPCSSPHSSVMVPMPPGFSFCLPLGLEYSFQESQVKESDLFLNFYQVSAQCQSTSKALPDDLHPPPLCPPPLFFALMPTLSVMYLFMSMYACLPPHHGKPYEGSTWLSSLLWLSSISIGSWKCSV